MPQKEFCKSAVFCSPPLQYFRVVSYKTTFFPVYFCVPFSFLVIFLSQCFLYLSSNFQQHTQFIVSFVCSVCTYFLFSFTARYTDSITFSSISTITSHIFLIWFWYLLRLLFGIEHTHHKFYLCHLRTNLYGYACLSAIMIVTHILDNSNLLGWLTLFHWRFKPSTLAQLARHVIKRCEIRHFLN